MVISQIQKFVLVEISETNPTDSFVFEKVFKQKCKNKSSRSFESIFMKETRKLERKKVKTNKDRWRLRWAQYVGKKL